MKILNETTESSGDIKISRTSIMDCMADEIEMLKKEVERLSAPLTIPDDEIDEGWSGAFRMGIRWALEYLNAQRKDGK